MARALGSRVSMITESRQELHEALAKTFVAPVNGVAYDGRVDLTQPAKLAAPRVWVGDSSGRRQTQGRATVYVGTFDVWVAFDGALSAQVLGVDEVVGRVVAAGVAAGFDVVGHGPAALPPELADQSKPNVRASLITIERAALFHTLCPPAATPPGA